MTALTCWKDIATYLGKGVRTVQRWERESGLPVRRSAEISSKRPVLAFREEIDAWMKDKPVTSNVMEEIRRLQRDNQDLRDRLALLERKTA